MRGILEDAHTARRQVERPLLKIDAGADALLLELLQEVLIHAHGQRISTGGDPFGVDHSHVLLDHRPLLHE